MGSPGGEWQHQVCKSFPLLHPGKLPLIQPQPPGLAHYRHFGIWACPACRMTSQDTRPMKFDWNRTILSCHFPCVSFTNIKKILSSVSFTPSGLGSKWQMFLERKQNAASCQKGIRKSSALTQSYTNSGSLKFLKSLENLQILFALVRASDEH